MSRFSPGLINSADELFDISLVPGGLFDSFYAFALNGIDGEEPPPLPFDPPSVPPLFGGGGGSHSYTKLSKPYTPQERADAIAKKREREKSALKTRIDQKNAEDLLVILTCLSLYRDK